MYRTAEPRVDATQAILLVEDNADERTIYSTLLGHGGYRVLAAGGYESGLRLARLERPAVAVVDIHLGEGRRDGCELIEALRRYPETASLPVVVLTAFGDVYRGRLERAGCRAILQKPMNPQQLLTLISRLAPSS